MPLTSVGGVSSARVALGDGGLDGDCGLLSRGVGHEVVSGREGLRGGVVGAGGGGEIFGRYDQPVIFCADDGDGSPDALWVLGRRHVLDRRRGAAATVSSDGP